MSRMGVRVPPLSRRQIQGMAQKLRNMLGLAEKPLFDIVAFLEHTMPEMFPDFSLEICQDKEHPLDYGLAYPDEQRIVLRSSIYNDAIRGVGWCRMTLAHEAGHLFLHEGVPAIFARSDPERRLAAYENSEWQADVFAGELLAPTTLIRGKTIEEVSREFKVSRSAATVQLSGLAKLPPEHSS